MRSELLSLLAEGIEGARERERAAFDRAAGAFAKSVVIYGAGGLGRKCLAALRAHNIELLAFADGNDKLWGQKIEGIDVLSPADAAARYGANAVFVIAIWRAGDSERMRDRRLALETLGCRAVVPFPLLFWKYPETLPHYVIDLPHKVHELRSDVLEAFDLWADEASRREYVAQIRWRLLADFDGLGEPAAHAPYFPIDICAFLPGEIFVDCGAYTGDTIADFRRETGGVFGEIVAFEPDPVTFETLKREAAVSRVRLRQAATTDFTGTIAFDASGSLISSAGSGDSTVEATTFDSEIERATFIKMDVEGTELDALAGARRLIRDCEPVLAISCEHKQEDIWKVPNFVHSVSKNYGFYLRPHLHEAWDLVCYAIPAGRLTV